MGRFSPNSGMEKNKRVSKCTLNMYTCSGGKLSTREYPLWKEIPLVLRYAMCLVGFHKRLWSVNSRYLPLSSFLYQCQVYISRMLQKKQRTRKVQLGRKAHYNLAICKNVPKFLANQENIQVILKKQKGGFGNIYSSLSKSRITVLTWRLVGEKDQITFKKQTLLWPQKLH